MGIEKKTFSFRFSEEMVERLRIYAQEENRTLSNLVETVLLAYLREKDQARLLKEQNDTENEE